MSDVKVGDRVRLTPKGDGESVIVGEVSYIEFEVLSVKHDGVTSANNYPTNCWNVEVLKPSTVDMLNALPNGSIVAGPTSNWCPYVKDQGGNGNWYEVMPGGVTVESEAESIAYWIDNRDFRVVHEPANE